MSEHNITLFEACEILNRSKKTLSRYIRRGRLKPKKITSQQGTLEYRFSKADIDALRVKLEQEAQEQTRRDRPDKTGQGRQDTANAYMEQDTPKINEISPKPEETGQDTQDRTPQKEPELNIIALLKDTTELLKAQLSIKDTQIGTLNGQIHKLIERDRETNILLKGLQDRIMLLEPPKETGKAKPGRTISKAQRIRQALLSILLLITLGVFFYYNLLPLIRSLYEISAPF